MTTSEMMLAESTLHGCPLHDGICSALHEVRHMLNIADGMTQMAAPRMAPSCSQHQCVSASSEIIMYLYSDGQIP